MDQNRLYPKLCSSSRKRVANYVRSVQIKFAAQNEFFHFNNRMNSLNIYLTKTIVMKNDILNRFSSGLKYIFDCIKVT